MRTTACLFVLVGLGLALASEGKERPVKAEPELTVEQLIARLGHRDFRVRDAAQRSLAARGTAALEALRKARKGQKDLEVARRLDQLIPGLERAALLAPKRVTLRLTNRPAKDALDELTRQTGYKFQVMNPGPNNQVHTFNLDQVPFWQALDEVCKADGLVLNNSWGQNSLMLNYEDGHSPHISHGGSFRLAATGFYYSRTINFGNAGKAGPKPDNRSETLTLNFNVCSEPKLPIL